MLSFHKLYGITNYINLVPLPDLKNSTITGRPFLILGLINKVRLQPSATGSCPAQQQQKVQRNISPGSKSGGCCSNRGKGRCPFYSSVPRKLWLAACQSALLFSRVWKGQNRELHITPVPITPPLSVNWGKTQRFCVQLWEFKR